MNNDNKIKGFASPKSTLEYKNWSIENQNIHQNHFREFEDLYLSSIGMGTYLGKPNKRTDEMVIDAALESINKGTNVIDTAINYRFQKAERAIGEVIKKLEDEGFNRNQIFISTKNGYIPGDADKGMDNSGYIEQIVLKQHLAKEEEIINFNCTAIPYLEHQLHQSLDNLNLKTIDLLYLHNVAESQKPVLGENKFYEMIEKCFRFLEEKRKENMLRYYGLATWDCFRVSTSNPHYVSLKKLVNISEKVAQEINNTGGFKFVMLPYNLLMPEASTMKFQEGKTFFKLADELEIGVFTSVPLMQGKILNEPEIKKLKKKYYVKTSAQAALQNVRSFGKPVLAPIVGHKQLEHVKENLEVAMVAPNT